MRYWNSCLLVSVARDCFAVICSAVLNLGTISTAVSQGERGIRRPKMMSETLRTIGFYLPGLLPASEKRHAKEGRAVERLRNISQSPSPDIVLENRCPIASISTKSLAIPVGLAVAFVAFPFRGCLSKSTSLSNFKVCSVARREACRRAIPRRGRSANAGKEPSKHWGLFKDSHHLSHDGCLWPLKSPSRLRKLPGKHRPGTAQISTASAKNLNTSVRVKIVCAGESA